MTPCRGYGSPAAPSPKLFAPGADGGEDVVEHALAVGCAPPPCSRRRSRCRARHAACCRRAWRRRCLRGGVAELDLEGNRCGRTSFSKTLLAILDEIRRSRRSASGGPWRRSRSGRRFTGAVVVDSSASRADRREAGRRAGRWRPRYGRSDEHAAGLADEREDVPGRTKSAAPELLLARRDGGGALVGGDAGGEGRAL